MAKDMVYKIGLQFETDNVIDIKHKRIEKVNGDWESLEIYLTHHSAEQHSEPGTCTAATDDHCIETLLHISLVL